jgi:hypothetical protein
MLVVEDYRAHRDKRGTDKGMSGRELLGLKPCYHFFICFMAVNNVLSIFPETIHEITILRI